MAGGKGERLYPLTRDRSKPAVPFGGRFRIVDFVLSNFINSGIYSLYILVQYKSQSVIEHLRTGWRLTGMRRDHFITVVPPQMRWADQMWYRGTADAVFQNLNVVREYSPDIVAVFGADHIYRMDIRQMIEFHLSKGADATVAALPVPIEDATGYGIVTADANGRVTGFDEKPKHPQAMPTDPGRAYSSMGNYLFNTGMLIDVLMEDSQRSTAHDFGKTIIPELFTRANVFAYNFFENQIPGLNSYEEPGYWRDVGNLVSYWHASMDILGRQPVLDLNNSRWPILGSEYIGPPTQIDGARLESAAFGSGSRVEDATVKRSILGSKVRVEPGAVIEDSVIMDDTVVGRGACVRRTIVDRFNQIEPGAQVYAGGRDANRYHVDSSGIVVVPRGRSVFATQAIPMIGV
ncbi:MAG: glucose-1-phosphate adenylyltransferase [Candidatus Omnitrophica bacterium]|nr:glucose-1-phosphate adenylyltransferase [Candidatus Omnitrophota bacterium]